MFLLKRKQSIQRIVLIGSGLFLIGIGITYLTIYYEGSLIQVVDIIKKMLVYSIENGRILQGFFYIPVGMMLSKKTIGKQRGWTLLFVGLISNYYIKDPGISTIFEAISSIGLFAVVEGICFVDSRVFPFVRKMSTVIYFIHMYVWSFYYKIIYGKKTYGLDSFIVTSIISSIIAIAYIYTKKRVEKRVIDFLEGFPKLMRVSREGLALFLVEFVRVIREGRS